ncbi:MAG TPA: AEC family transporter [Steroidobacteraceae bacterium]|nr:AEC family transporter [Steroidobacteraceae bacterium]
MYEDKRRAMKSLCMGVDNHAGPGAEQESAVCDAVRQAFSNRFTQPVQTPDVERTSTTMLANTLIPIFAGLLVGYVAGLWRVMDNRNVQPLITFVMSFAIPCALFLAVASAPLRVLYQQLAPALVLAIIYVALYGVSFLWVRSREHMTLSHSAVFALTLGFPNAAAVGLPLLESVFGASSRVAIAVALAIGSITVTPLTLLILEADKSGVRSGLAWKTVFPALGHAIRMPVVWAPVLGLLFSCAGLNLPSFANRSLTIIGSSAEGAALVLTGLVVSAQPFKVRGATLVAVLLKNIAQPALALCVAWAIRLPIDQLREVTLIGAIPCGFFGLVFGERFGPSPPLASSSLIVSYAAGIATLAMWIAIVAHLHY